MRLEGRSEPPSRAGVGPADSVGSSYEVRWFFAGEPPPAVVRAFRSVTPWPARPDVSGLEWSPSRTDRYLVFAEDLGIKSRRDRDTPPLFELKARTADHGDVVMGPDVQGRAETWVKWSYGIRRVPHELATVLEEGTGSVGVQKERILRLVRLVEGAPPEEVAHDERVPRGIQLELARVSLLQRSGASFWTLGVEAFPADAGVAAQVLPVVGSFLVEVAREAALPLPRARSMSYPAWLTRLGDSRGG